MGPSNAFRHAWRWHSSYLQLANLEQCGICRLLSAAWLECMEPELCWLHQTTLLQDPLQGATAGSRSFVMSSKPQRTVSSLRQSPGSCMTPTFNLYPLPRAAHGRDSPGSPAKQHCMCLRSPSCAPLPINCSSCYRRSRCQLDVDDGVPASALSCC